MRGAEGRYLESVTKELQVSEISFADVLTVLCDQIHKHVVRKRGRRKVDIVRLEAFTIFHVVLSLVGIISGIVVMYGLLVSREFESWTEVFLAATVATSVTGFFFPSHGFTPALGLGILSLLVLSLAIFALRRTYVISFVVALYSMCLC